MPPNIKIEIHQGAIRRAAAPAKKIAAQLIGNDKNNRVVKKENASGVKPITPIQKNKNPDHSARETVTAVPSPPALDGRLSSEKTDFERAEEKKTAHFMKRLENARLELRGNPEKRDRELEKLDEFLSSLTMRRTNTVKRETTRKTANERKKARGAQPVSDAKDVPVAATVTVPVGSPVKDGTSVQALSESSGNKKKNLLHSKSSSGNKISKSMRNIETTIRKADIRGHLTGLPPHSKAMPSNRKISFKASTTAAAQGRGNTCTKKLASLNHEDSEAKAHQHIGIHKNPLDKAAGQTEKKPALALDNNQVLEKENTKNVKLVPSTQKNDGPGHSANKSASDALSRSALVERPFPEMTDFEKAEERKTAHFMKRLEYARKELEIRDRELEKFDKFVRSLAMRRTNTAKHETARKAVHKHKKSRSPQPTSADKEASIATPVTAPVASLLMSKPSGNKKKDILHSKSGNKISKASPSGWATINHKK
ncbi:hypothetical protein BZA77DRAFT_361051 [Pyronema omphalodes]|nr:hypothetical protein BZA77DRAFT_361051 [Pyronema omphalodes]